MKKGKPVLAFASKINLGPTKDVYSISFLPLGRSQNSSIAFLLPQMSLCPRIATHLVLLPSPQDPTLDSQGRPRNTTQEPLAGSPKWAFRLSLGQPTNPAWK